MERPHSGPTAVVIAVQPVPGKYAWNRLSGPQFPGTICPGRCDVICTRLASPQMVKLQPSYPAGTPSAPATTPTPGAMPARNHAATHKNITLKISISETTSVFEKMQKMSQKSLEINVFHSSRVHRDRTSSPLSIPLTA